jgi:hypothetical protein
MSAVELAESIVKLYPELSYSIEGRSITVAPPTSDGFSVWLSLDAPEGEFVVGFDILSLDVEDEWAALNCFA